MRASSNALDGERSSTVGDEDLVALDQDHPGFRDPVYRARRNDIARIARNYVDGDPVPRIAYSDEEHSVWRAVWEKIRPLHDRFACREYLASRDRLALPHDQIPQLADVNATLEPSTGFRMIPVAGLVSSRAFLAQLGQSRFLSTQYIRHASQPLYTPEPDVVHELIGHACTLSDVTLAALNRLFGRAAAHVDEAGLVELERLYWYTMEFGVVEQDGALKAYGAGLLSSFGELERFSAEAEIRPFDPEEASGRAYDPTTYQAVLYRVSDLHTLTRQVTAWLTTHATRTP